MTRISRRAQSKQDRREGILRAATQVFAQAGYSAATMDTIAVQAGLSKPTLYQYFESKEALFAAMMQVPGEAMMLAFEDGASPDYVAQLHSFATRYARTVMRPDFLSIARLIIGEAQRFPDVGRAYQAAGPDKVLAALTAFMTRQCNAGRLHITNPVQAAQDFWGLILSGPRTQALHIPDDIPDAHAIALSVQNGIAVFLRAYSANPAADQARLETLINADLA